MKGEIRFNYVATLFIAVLISCFLHEFAHWITGEILGNRMSMSLNGANPISGEYPEQWHANIISIAGPLLTILQAIIFYYIIHKRQNINLYPFMFFPFVYRFAAGIANVFGANDEGRVGLSFGLGLYTISVVFSGLLLFLVWKVSTKYKLGLKFNLITFLLSAVFLFTIVFIDQYFKIKIIG
ncbi:hypothetical protein [Roseivirga misakiensis]|uniref:Peptidase M50 domain-containing protein n=1 Tax=Roseivirga misakiensis TaxID=1563681 RepID=A0A1E5T0N7_9BACT|nr:hypothetical protein [Roseivirga misakiensis]OEK04943.1 hypothetical protein BFP71_16040 [Roseivirga misakiensis]